MGAARRALLFVRSLVFLIGQSALTVVFALAALLTFPFPPFTRYRVITQWSRAVLWLAKHVCGLHWQVIGAERIPDRAGIVLSKHQSAWETLALQSVFPPQVWVLKRELLRVPFFGWGLAMMSPIAIDRSNGRRALQQLQKQGAARLGAGFWIVVFPEGTRVAPGEHRPYQIGGAWLATHTGAPVVPVAHNAGTVWPKHAFLKPPGMVTMSIGPVIDPTGLKPDALNRQVEAWIEAEVARLGSARA